MDDYTLSQVQAVLGYTFANPTLLVRALTHASLVDVRADSNERMEFLGDAVLGLIVCHSLYERYPRMLEGEMTKIKSLVVSRETCAGIARDLSLDRFLAMGKGMKTHGEAPMSMIAAVLEAVVAALYLDAGYDAAVAFVRPRVDPIIDAAAATRHQHNFKSFLQQHAQQMGWSAPQYRVLDEQGPDHAKCFKVAVDIGGRRFEACWGNSKKKAEQDAAFAALKELGALDEALAAESAKEPNAAP